MRPVLSKEEKKKSFTLSDYILTLPHTSCLTINKHLNPEFPTFTLRNAVIPHRFCKKTVFPQYQANLNQFCTFA